MWFSRRRAPRIRDEVRFHRDQMIEDYVAQGVDREEAERRAFLELGNPDAIEEATRDARGRWLDHLAQDLRYGLRMLRRNPGFAVVAILSLALGIGANTAIVSLMDTVLLRALPVERADELVFLEVVGSEGRGGAPPYPVFERFRAETSAFAGMAAFTTDHLRLEVDGRVEQVFGQVASGGYFDVLGLIPAAGRLMTVDDETADRPVAVIGYGYWQRRFGGAPDAIGKMITFRDRTYTIIGVTPPSFWGLEPGRQVEVTLPIVLERSLLIDTGAWWFDAVARLRPGVPVERATAQVDTIFQSFMNDRARSQELFRHAYFDHMELTSAARGTSGLRSRFATPLYALALVAGAVLLIACANLGNLLLVRGAARERELAIRLATGAGAGRILRQLLTETLLLFLLGAVASVAVAVVTTRTLTGFVAVGRNPILLDVHYDWRLVACAAGVALVAGLVTGLWPARQAVRIDPHTAMKDGEGRLAGSRRLSAAGRVLGVSQVALSLVLVVAAVVFVRTMINLRASDLGFEPTRVLTMSLDPRLPRDAPAGAREQFWTQVLERVRALPGVRAASLSVLTPLSGRNVGRFVAADGFQPRNDSERMVHLNHVSEDYFETFGIQVLGGRVPTVHDADGAPRVAVVNEAAARAYFGGRDPIGETLTFDEADTYHVVGVVRDHKHRSVREDAPRFAYVPLWQPVDANTRITLSVSSTQSAAVLSRAIADDVRALDPTALVSDVISAEEQIDATLVTERLLSTLAAGFAVLALGVSAIGLYGVLSYTVARRTAELGVRLALGATPAHIAWNVFRGVLGQVAVGIALGLPIAALAVRAAEELLFGVTSAALSSYVLGVTMLTVVAFLAAWLPARRASRVDPLIALRHE